MFVGAGAEKGQKKNLKCSKSDTFKKKCIDEVGKAPFKTGLD